MNRSHFLTTTVLIGLFVMSDISAVADKPETLGGSHREQWVLVSLNKDRKLLLYALDKKTGGLELRTQTTTEGRPGSIGLAPGSHHFYVAMHDRGSVAAFSIGHDGALTQLGEGRIGENPSYVSVHPGGKFVASAYYAAGKVAVHRTSDDGSIVPEAVQIIDTDENAHAAVWDRTGRNLFIPHTRPDTIRQFAFDPATGKLAPNDPSTLQRENNSGPRHLWFHPLANVAYSSDERGRSITSYTYDSREGALTTARTISSLPPEGFVGGSTSDIEVHSSGKFVYIANRGHDSLAGFAIDPTDRTRLTLVSHTPTEPVPRSFNISPDGKFIVAAGQKSGKLAVFRVGDDGRLNRSSTIEAGAAPSWVQFVNQPAEPATR